MAKSEWYGKERLREINQKLKDRMVLASEFVKNEAKRTVPWDTHNLRDSIDKEVIIDNGEVVGRIGTNVEYAYYVEFMQDYGKSPIKAGTTAPFLLPALVSNKEQITNFLTK